MPHSGRTKKGMAYRSTKAHPKPPKMPMKNAEMKKEMKKGK